MTQFPDRSDLSPRAPKWALPPSQVKESERSFDANAFKTSIALAFAWSSEGTALVDAFAESKKHAPRDLFYNCTFMCTTLIHAAEGRARPYGSTHRRKTYFSLILSKRTMDLVLSHSLGLASVSNLYSHSSRLPALTPLPLVLRRHTATATYSRPRSCPCVRCVFSSRY